jgi:hypothetical protein
LLFARRENLPGFLDAHDLAGMPPQYGGHGLCQDIRRFHEPHTARHQLRTLHGGDPERFRGAGERPSGSGGDAGQRRVLGVVAQQQAVGRDFAVGQRHAVKIDAKATIRQDGLLNVGSRHRNAELACQRDGAACDRAVQPGRCEFRGEPSEEHHLHARRRRRDRLLRQRILHRGNLPARRRPP